MSGNFRVVAEELPFFKFYPKMLGIRAAHRHVYLVTPRRIDSRVIGNLSLQAVSAHQQRSNSSSTWHKNAQAGFSVGNNLYNKYGYLVDSRNIFIHKKSVRVRPTYPSESIAFIWEDVKATPPLNMAEYDEAFFTYLSFIHLPILDLALGPEYLLGIYLLIQIGPTPLAACMQ